MRDRKDGIVQTTGEKLNKWSRISTVLQDIKNNWYSISNIGVWQSERDNKKPHESVTNINSNQVQERG